MLPYSHWPDCNWCATVGRSHLVHSGDEVNATSPDSSNEHPDSSSALSDEVSLREEDVKQDGQEEREEPSLQDSAPHRSSNEMRRSRGFVVRRNDISTPKIYSSAATFEEADYLPQMPLGGPLTLPTPLPSNIVSSPSTHDSASQTTDPPGSNTHGPAQAAAKTSRISCTPSPTESLPPSATWTTCPYVVRDGRVNPDVQTLNGPGAINGISQAVICNAMAYAISNSTVYPRNFVRFIDAFFLDESTRMHPDMNYGQIVRGPGAKGSSGTWCGILDLRGIVKVVNGILIMKGMRSPDWTIERDQSMNSWITQYAEWLTQSNLGKEAASRPNNHASFYVSQVAATKLYVGDRNGAAAILKNYFSSQFLDQIAKSGEQPFEAVRTRPFHYRCFGLEAMITNAKLGDELGLNFWTARSRYGATIQTAVDYTMNIDPKSEDVTELVPHIAAIAAAYGDPMGKYAKFLEKTIPNYQSRPFFFYDQTMALPVSRMNGHAERADTSRGMVSFECSEILKGKMLEIDAGVYVTCEEMVPYYEM